MRVGSPGFWGLLATLATLSAQAAPSSLPREIGWLKAEAQWKRIPYTSLYYDHAQALLAQSRGREAQGLLKAKNWKMALLRAREAQAHWLALQDRVSTSAWLPRVASEMGRQDLVIAQAQFAQKDLARALASFERAWDRIPFSMAEVEQVSQYFTACQKREPAFWKDASLVSSCANWGRRLIFAFPGQSPERAELQSRWSEAVSALAGVEMPSSQPRVNQSYRTPDDDQAAWEAILPLLRESRLSSLRRPLEQFLESYPQSPLRHKARYWLAVSQMTRNEVPADFRPLLEKVCRESPLSFYGLLSATLLGKTPEEFLTPAAPASRPRDPSLHPTQIRALEKAEALLASREPALLELAQMELRQIRPKSNHHSEFLVHLAGLNEQAGSYLGTFLALTELIQRGAPEAMTQWAAERIFPVERWQLIQQNAEALKIDPIWVLALMKQESAFDLGAISSSGAVGLMQVMPATAVSTDPTILRRLLPEDAHNVRIGTTYMAQMLRRFRGNLALATAAYNAGPTAVERWMKEYGLKDTENGLSLGMIEFIESIPYRETRDYVGSIIRNYHWYSARLPRVLKQQPATLTDRKPLQYFWVRVLGSATAAEK